MNGSHYYQMRDKNGKPIPNTYRIQIYTGTGPNGKPRRHTEVFKGRVGELKKHIADLVHQLNKGVPLTTGRLTVGEHLQQWLEGYCRTNCSPRTFEGYEGIIRRHLIPSLGHLQLKDLTPAVIQSYYGKACQRVLPRTGKKTSARTVHHIHRVLFQSLKYAVRQGYLGRNPAELTDPPKPQRKQMNTLNQAEADHLLQTAKDSPHYPVIYTALGTGLRQAELLGLRWRDLDLNMCSISVSQVLYKRGGVCEFKQPKTEHSRRRVGMTPRVAVYLRGYLAEREKLYQEWEAPLTPDTLVFTNAIGKPVNPSVLSHEFHKIVKRAGLENIRFHDLRHSFASLMLLKGIHPKIVSHLLGHASVGFTLDVYSHIISGMEEDALKIYDEVLPEGIVQSFNTKITHELSDLRTEPL